VLNEKCMCWCFIDYYLVAMFKFKVLKIETYWQAQSVCYNPPWQKHFIPALLIVLQSAILNLLYLFAYGFKWRHSFAYDILLRWPINLLEPEFYIEILAHPVGKMRIIQEPNKLALWNKRHFEKKKTEIMQHV